MAQQTNVAVPNIQSIKKGFFDRTEWQQLLQSFLNDLIAVRNTVDLLVNHNHTCNAQAATSSVAATGLGSPQALGGAGTQIPAVPTVASGL